MPTIMDSKTGVVDKWIKKEGDIVHKSEIICEATLSDLTIGFI
jgi:pyruvate/2-oxoglutarate dehydrogenase complex dihydrolipoamide acyltransferase (E2) component